MHDDLENDPEYQLLIASFVATLRERADDLERALDREDLARLVTIAHQLRGTATSYGFPSITAEAAALEASARAERLDQARRRVGSLVELCRGAGAAEPPATG